MHFSKPFPSISGAGHGLKSARVIQSVSRRVSFFIGACLYKLWNSHDFPIGLGDMAQKMITIIKKKR